MTQTEKPTLPISWNWVRLNTLGKLIGGGTPSRKVDAYFQGDIPWATIKDLHEDIFELTDTQEHITPEAVEESATNLIEPGSLIIATRVGLGKIAINQSAVTINQDLKALQANRKGLPKYILYALRKLTFDILKYGQGSTVKGILQSDLLNIEIPLPPIAVQERIIETLQKADDIRHKRLDAVKIAEALPSALFYEMFNEYLSHDLVSLGNGIDDIQNGITRRRKTNANVGTIVLRIQDVGDGVIDYGDLNRIDLSENEQVHYSLESGDMLLVRVNGNPNLVGRSALFAGYSDTVAHNDHLMRIRFKKEKFLPEFVDAYLRTAFGKAELRSKVATSAGNHTINQNGIKSIKIPDLPLDLQRGFVDRASKISSISKEKTIIAVHHSNAIFNALLNQAFTGELTAAWEAAHAEDIAAYQRLHEQLPVLLLLAFIQAKAEETARQDAMLITALMKYTFLAHMEGHARRRLFHFVPYHYGPFSKEVYAGLEELQRQGVVTVEDSPDEGRTRIVLADPAQADKTLSDLPDDLRRDVQTIIDQYGALEHNDLLKTVYEKYPAYAKKSRITKKLREA